MGVAGTVAEQMPAIEGADTPAARVLSSTPELAPALPCSTLIALDWRFSSDATARSPNGCENFGAIRPFCGPVETCDPEASRRILNDPNSIGRVPLFMHPTKRRATETEGSQGNGGLPGNQTSTHVAAFFN
jgi:hypothetical protein